MGGKRQPIPHISAFTNLPPLEERHAVQQSFKLLMVSLRSFLPWGNMACTRQVQEADLKADTQ